MKTALDEVLDVSKQTDIYHIIFSPSAAQKAFLSGIALILLQTGIINLNIGSNVLRVLVRKCSDW